MSKIPVWIQLRDKEYAQKMEEYLSVQYGERIEMGGEGSDSVVITDQAEDAEDDKILLNFDNIILPKRKIVKRKSNNYKKRSVRRIFFYRSKNRKKSCSNIGQYINEWPDITAFGK